MSKSYVYLIHRHPYDGFVKIGVTTTPTQRLAAAQCWSPVTLSMTLFPGDLYLERRIQRRLQKYRHRGEWFRLSLKQLERIKGWIAIETIK